MFSRNGEDVDRPLKNTINQDSNSSIQNNHIIGLDDHLLEGFNSPPVTRYLPPRELAWLPVGLTYLLQIQLTKDNIEHWKITYEMLLEMNDEHDLIPPDLVENFRLLIDLIVHGDSIQSFDEIEIHKKNILRQSKLLATYVGYPTLEGFVKVVCSDDINIDGTLTSGGRIRRLGPRNKHDYYERPAQHRCSNLGALLWYLETRVAGKDSMAKMKSMRQEIAELYETEVDEVYGMLRDFRNRSLHGQNQAKREYGVILNLICLVVWMIIYPDVG